MTKTELSEILFEEYRNLFPTKESARAAVNAVLGGIERALERGDSLSLHDFGKFVVRVRPPRIGRNPRTGLLMKIPGSRTVTFKPAARLKSLVNSGVPHR